MTFLNRNEMEMLRAEIERLAAENADLLERCQQEILAEARRGLEAAGEIAAQRDELSERLDQAAADYLAEVNLVTTLRERIEELTGALKIFSVFLGFSRVVAEHAEAESFAEIWPEDLAQARAVYEALAEGRV